MTVSAANRTLIVLGLGAFLGAFLGTLLSPFLGGALMAVFALLT